MTLSANSMQRWRRDPCAFITEVLHDPETEQPFVLLPAERTFLEHAFRTDANGRLVYPEQIFGAIKKSGKTAFAGLHVLVTVLLFGGAYAEAVCCANDYEQSVARVFQAIVRIVTMSPLLCSEAKITANKIEFLNGATITAIASDYAGAAGGNANITVFDELWAYTSERARRLFDEMIVPPTRKIALRLTVTYAGFEGESLLLEELYKRGLSQPQIGADLYAGDGLLMAWHREPIAPWQTPEWIAQMRRALRPNQFARMIENRFVANETSFVDMREWDACVDPELTPIMENRALPVWLAVDASLKRDSTVVLVCSYDHDGHKVRLVNYRVFQPSPDKPLDFETTIEQTVKDYCGRYNVQAVQFDPWQMQSVAQRLRAWGAPMCEFNQTLPNLTAIGTNLYELIRSRSIVVYPSDDLRLAISRAVIKESERGMTITKTKAAHKIDLVISLAMAARAVVERGPYTPPLVSYGGIGVYSQPRVHVGDGGEASETMLAWLATQNYGRAPDGGLGRGSAHRSGSIVW
jgi:hypothetical protein